MRYRIKSNPDEPRGYFISIGHILCDRTKKRYIPHTLRKNCPDFINDLFDFVPEIEYMVVTQHHLYVVHADLYNWKSLQLRILKVLQINFDPGLPTLEDADQLDSLDVPQRRYEALPHMMPQYWSSFDSHEK